MFVSVAFSSSIRNFSPLSGVMRLIVNRMPSALRLSMRMPRKLRNNSVDIARITSGLLESAVSPLRNSRPEFVGGGEETVPQTGVLLLVADLLEHVRQQILGGLVLRFGLHQLVQDFLGEEVLALVVEFPAAGEDLRRAAHHLHKEGRGFALRQRDEGGRIAVPEPEEALDDAAAVVFGEP